MMSSQTDISDVDFGFNDIIDAVKKSTQITLDAGIFEDAPPYPADNGITDVVTVATMQEEGFEIDFKHDKGVSIAQVPPRPFMQKTLDNRANDWLVDFNKDLKLKFDSFELKETLDGIGRNMSHDIKTTIETFTDPPNSEEYVRTMKPDVGNNPLIRTRHMQECVTYKVRTKWDS